MSAIQTFDNARPPWAEITPSRYGYWIKWGEHGMECVQASFRFTAAGAWRVAKRKVHRMQRNAAYEAAKWTVTE